MTANNLTSDREFMYICQWFNEFSELQREDFVPIAADYILKDSKIYMNGVVSGLQNSNCDDKPLSLFQCRIKLFKEWSPKWPEEMKLKLKEKIIELDPKIGEKLEKELGSEIPNGNVVNGNVVVDQEQHVVEQGDDDEGIGNNTEEVTNGGEEELLNSADVVEADNCTENDAHDSGASVDGE